MGQNPHFERIISRSPHVTTPPTSILLATIILIVEICHFVLGGRNCRWLNRLQHRICPQTEGFLHLNRPKFLQKEHFHASFGDCGVLCDRNEVMFLRWVPFLAQMVTIQAHFLRQCA